MRIVAIDTIPRGPKQIARNSMWKNSGYFGGRLRQNSQAPNSPSVRTISQQTTGITTVYIGAYRAK
jgi:hypothetical protein